MAVQVLYQSEITGQSVQDILTDGTTVIPDGGSLPPYAVQLVEGVADNQDAIDAKLTAASENWALDRMPIVDRAIMRMAVYEMLYQDDVPISVSINEAVELAKEFGGEDDSARFANGILGRIARVGEKEDGAEVAGEDAGETEFVVETAAPETADEAAAASEEGIADAK
jgi:N utilization substance protein B